MGMISEGDVIKLSDGEEYMILAGKKITRDFCLAATTEAPVKLRVLQMQPDKDNGKLEVRQYEGEDKAEILTELMEK